MSKKEILAKCIDTLIPDSLYRYIINMCQSNFVVLAYHRVIDVDHDYPFDIELISASCKQFDEQMSFISKYFTPVTIEQVVDSYKNNLKLPKKAILVTFDDGFEDNYKNAFPILKKYSVPATIFLSTDFISSDNTLWFDRLSYFIMNYDLAPIQDVVKNKFKIDCRTNNKRTILEQVMEYVKVIPNSDREKLLSDLYNEYEFTYKSKDKKLSTTLNWEQIKEMDNSCISFGSHTLSHPILSQLDTEELSHELIESKRIIEQKLEHDIDTIAYPVGTQSAFNSQVIRQAQKADYVLGFSYLSGANKWPLKNEFTINRYHVERYISTPLFKCMLSLQKIFLR